jgi:hypothetical protein
MYGDAKGGVDTGIGMGLASIRNPWHHFTVARDLDDGGDREP